jgi:FtsZ-binding cell division protein ZapB
MGKLIRSSISVFILLICIGNAKAQDNKAKVDSSKETISRLIEQCSSIIKKFKIDEKFIDWGVSQEGRQQKSCWDKIYEYMDYLRADNQRLQTEKQRLETELSAINKKLKTKEKELQKANKELQKEIEELQGKSKKLNAEIAQKSEAIEELRREEKSLQKEIAVWQEHNEGILTRADSCFKAGNYSAAILHYIDYRDEKGTQNIDALIDWAKECQQILIDADDWFAKKNYKNAAAKYQELLKLNPADRHAKERYDFCISKNTEPKEFHFGIVGGLSITNQLSDSWMYKGAQNPQFGFVGGLLFEHKLNRYLSFQPELRFIMKGSHGKGYTSDIYYIEINGHRDYLSNVLVENTLNLNYLELPLNLVLNIPVSKTTDLFIGAGYYLAYGVSGKLKLLPSKERYSFEEEKWKDVFSGESEILKLNSLDRGINCMLGFRSYFDKEKDGGSFFIRAGYERSLDNISIRGRNTATFKNNCFYISMGVFLQ